jgi:hypothetical protein
VTLSKFVAILVVFGHYHGGGFRSESFLQIKTYLMPFRMPLFVALSGFLFFLGTSRLNYWRFLKGKIDAVLVPYISIYLLFFLIKMVAGEFFSFSKPASFEDLYYILFEPKAGFESFLWFLYVLFMFFAISPILLKLPYGFSIMGVIAGVLYCLPLPEVFSLNLFGSYYLWFWFGGVFNIYHRKIPFSWGMILVIVTLYFGSVYLASQYGMKPPLLFFPQLLGSLFVISFCKRVEVYGSPLKSGLRFLGENSYSIYIWHNSLVMPPVVFFYKKVFGIRSEFDFYVGLLISLVACSVFPPLISKILEKNNVTRWLLLGKRREKLGKELTTPQKAIGV